MHKRLLFLLALVSCASEAHAADCSLSLGATIAGRGDTSLVSAGCTLRAFEIALHHVGRRDMSSGAPVAGTANLYRRVLADPHAALSVARLWQMERGSFALELGIGVWLKQDERYWDSPATPCHREDARPHLAARRVTDTYCVNPWVPSPLSAYLPVRLAWRSWRLSYAHVSNAGTARPNRGQDTLQLGYVRSF